MSTRSFKLVVIGGDASGKTSFVRRAFGRPINEHYEATTTVESQDLPITIQSLNQKIVFEIYDLPGSDRFMVLNRMYLRDTNAALIVIDQTNSESLHHAEAWVQELKETAPESAILAVAFTKHDSMNKAVSVQEGQAFARKHNIKMMSEVSAISGNEIVSLLQKIAVACYESKDQFVSEIYFKHEINLIRLIVLADPKPWNIQTCTNRKLGWRYGRRKKKEGKVLLRLTSSPQFADVDNEMIMPNTSFC